ncbi:MAG: HAMP domain-containing histidine kinase [Candidatus Wallbacteria bacterium]|nr:HAMP domain-containing histidine kinase [Candidatus Wallbacteria bacterium]
MQASLTRSEELERLRDSLVHMMAHDMRTPLMALRGNLELLDMDLREGLQPEQTAMLDTAFGACTKLIEMVSAMLDVSKLESGQMTVNRQPGDIAELAGQAVRTVGGLARRCEVQIQTADPSTRANVDHDLTHRVIVNLLGNALKFTPAGGRITIGIRAEGSEIEVSVQDTGPGIPAEFHEKIFEKFGQVQGQVKQAKYSTGLGLTFCRLAVEAMGGRIGVASEPGKGSTFWFRLPRV